MNNYHVEPINDKFPHNTKSSVCLCNPRIDKQSNGVLIIIHNSWDKREIWERARKKGIN
mgnify:CR=1 FL=1